MTAPTPAVSVNRSFSPVRTRSTVPLTRRAAPRVIRVPLTRRAESRVIRMMKVATVLDVLPATRASVAQGRQPGVIAL